MKLSMPGFQYSSTASLIRQALLSAILLMSLAFAQGQGNSPRREQVKELEFRVELNRIVPRAITIEAGQYRIRIRNGVYIAPLEFTINNAPNALAASVANRVSAVANVDRSNRLKVNSTFQPGTYILTVTDHPELTAVLTVTPGRGK